MYTGLFWHRPTGHRRGHSTATSASRRKSEGAEREADRLREEIRRELVFLHTPANQYAPYVMHCTEVAPFLNLVIISEGKNKPYRVKFRSPGFSNLSALDKMARGTKIADLVAIMSTLDFVIPDIDR